MRSCMGRRRLLAACFAAFGGSLAAYSQTILRVDAAAPAGGDGATWASAYHDLQDALQAAIPLAAQGASVELWVAAGVYRPDGGTGDRSARFELLNNIALYGGFVGVEALREQRDPNPLNNGTVLTGDLLGDDAPAFVNRGDNSYNVVFTNETNASATLDGFVVRAGNADGVGSFGSPLENGGGLHLRHSDATVRNCLFDDNSAGRVGGGVYLLADFADLAPTLERCLFFSNRAADGGGLGADESVGRSALPMVSDCTFISNAATNRGGGARTPGAFNHVQFLSNTAQDGAGMHVFRGDLYLFDCDFADNIATGFGGGLHVTRGQYSTTASAAGVRFERNDAGDDGGGLFTNTAMLLTECQFRGNVAADQGGAIAFDAYIQQNGQHAVVTALADTLIIDGNDAARGGAIAVLHAAQPRLDGSRLHNNSATVRGGAIETDRQGAVFAPEVHATGCDFRWNSAPIGGAVYNNSASTYVLCDFVHNYATSNGGAVYAIQVFSPLFTYCRFHGNLADGHGGALYNINSNVVLDNCELIGNRAVGEGGGLHGATASSNLRNCTVTGNVSGGTFGGGIYHPGLNLSVANSIVWGNAPDGLVAAGESFLGAARYSCLAGGVPGPGVFDSNPHFRRVPSDGGDGWADDPATPADERLNDDFGDLALQANSPCIDAGDNDHVPDDLSDIDVDGVTSEPLPWDILGESRFHEDTGAPNVGVGAAPLADIGAYEFQRTSRLPGDTNCDGRVDFFDVDPFLLALFDAAVYGAAFPACAGNADVNLDGAVNFFDIDLFVMILIP